MEINSCEYWEGRFSQDWKVNLGPEQSRMFAEVAVAMLPDWLKGDVQSRGMKLVDIGCAEGDALPVLAGFFGESVEVTGVDFSEKAIESAREKYPDYRFSVDDASNMAPGLINVVFCSNVLEHFHEPLPVLENLVNVASDYVVIVVPFWEFSRDIEHFVTFDASSFPVSVGNMTLAYWNVADISQMQDTLWLGCQAVLIYAASSAIQRNDLKMHDLVRNSYFPGLSVGQLLSAAKDDPALHRSLQISSWHGGQLLGETSASPEQEFGQKLEAVAARQEAIGYALHEQLGEVAERIEQPSSGLAQEIEQKLEVVAARQEAIGHALHEQLERMRERLGVIDESQASHSLSVDGYRAGLEGNAATLQMLEKRLVELTSVVDSIAAEQDSVGASLEKRFDSLAGHVDNAFGSVLNGVSVLVDAVEGIQSELGRAALADLARNTEVYFSSISDSIENRLMQQGLAIDRNTSVLDDFSKVERDIEVMEMENKGMAGNIAELELKIAELQSRFAVSEAGRNIAEAKLRAIESSRSWRITAPLRGLMSMFSGKGGTSAGVFDIPAGPVPLESSAVEEKPDYRAELEEILLKHAGRKIIVFRPLVDWDLPLFQRPHHIAARLARQGFLYFYCTPNAYDGMDGFREIEDGLYLTNQFDLVSGLYMEKFIHLYSTDNHCSLDYVRGQQRNLARIVYEYIDEIDPTISGVEIPQYVWDKHNALIEDESVVCIASADKLYQEVLEKRSGNAALVTNGVEYEHFTSELASGVPTDIADWVQSGKPIVGYFGALATWFDYELVEKCARTYPECNFLLLGWDYDGTLGKSNLAALNNVRVIGPIPYKRLPEYARFFDISTIPFKINAVTESTSPIKLFEYMSMGKPIVTTDMPECRKYKSVMIGRDHSSYVSLIGAALDRRTDADYKKLLHEEALANTWDAKAKVISELLN